MGNNSLSLSEYRCVCGKLLLKGIVFDGNLEIKCRRCGEITKIGEAKLIEDSSHYILIIDDKGLITNISDSACQILGYGREELLGKSITQINATLPKEIGIKFFGPETLLNADNNLRIDSVHVTKHNEKLPVTILLKLYLPTSKDKYILEYVTLKNNTLESEIPRSDIEQFIENKCDYYFDVDKNGIIEHISESMGKLFNYSQEKVISKNYFEFLPFTMIAKEKITFKHFVDKEQSYRVIQNVGLDTSGQIIRSDLYFTTKFNEVGKFIGYRVLGWVTVT